MIWRWDQGRTTYFNFSAICKIAKVLARYNGADMQVVDSGFRDELMHETGLPFAPQHYTVKRNYKRVFQCQLLATYIGNRLFVSDIGRAIANQDPGVSTADGYLYEVMRRFRYPFPAFQNYSDARNVCYPFFAILKLLFAKALRTGNTQVSITLDEIGAHLIANSVSGLEDLDFYWELSPREYSFDTYSSSDQRRQVREMMSFVGQTSFLMYTDSKLTLIGKGLEEYEDAFNSLVPYSDEVNAHNAVDDFLKITAYSSDDSKIIPGVNEDDAALQHFEVEEGKLIFVSHFSRERDSALRKEFIKLHPDPVCEICKRNMRVMYPWTENMLEIHHLCPLVSFSGDDEHTTTVDEVVGICPSCHRAVHLYYKRYLQEKQRTDFESTEEASEVYNQAKSEVVLE